MISVSDFQPKRNKREKAPHNKNAEGKVECKKLVEQRKNRMNTH
jgi:hypothetical protein